MWVKGVVVGAQTRTPEYLNKTEAKGGGEQEDDTEEEYMDCGRVTWRHMAAACEFPNPPPRDNPSW